jgi:hypothetical protein
MPSWRSAATARPTGGAAKTDMTDGYLHRAWWNASRRAVFEAYPITGMGQVRSMTQRGDEGRSSQCWRLGSPRPDTSRASGAWPRLLAYQLPSTREWIWGRRPDQSKAFAHAVLHLRPAGGASRK